MAGRSIREPDAALAGRRQVTRRDGTVAGVVLMLFVSAVAFVRRIAGCDGAATGPEGDGQKHRKATVMQWIFPTRTRVAAA